jgi:WD40 repeat protein
MELSEEYLKSFFPTSFGGSNKRSTPTSSTSASASASTTATKNNDEDTKKCSTSSSSSKIEEKEKVEEEDFLGPMPVRSNANDSDDDDDDDIDDEAILRPGLRASSSSSSSTSSSLSSSRRTINNISLIPLSDEVEFSDHEKTVQALALDPSGSRLLTGSADYSVKFWDFAGMDSNLRSFRTITPWDGYPIRSLCYSLSGDRFLVATGSSQGRCSFPSLLQVQLFLLSILMSLLP